MTGRERGASKQRAVHSAGASREGRERKKECAMMYERAALVGWFARAVCVYRLPLYISIARVPPLLLLSTTTTTTTERTANSCTHFTHTLSLTHSLSPPHLPPHTPPIQQPSFPPHPTALPPPTPFPPPFHSLSLAQQILIIYATEHPPPFFSTHSSS